MSTISLLERYGRAPSGAHVSCLVCRACGHETPVEATNICERCFGPLEVRYDYEEVARRISRESIAAGPPSIWRYRDLLPVDLEETEPITLGEGFTPLIHARNLGAELGLRNLYLKNDTQNPTGSFKDRVVSVAATWAREHGLTTIACASTGNLANSVAAYAAHAGLRAVVVVPSDLEPAKMIGTSIFRPTIIAVDGSYDDVNRLCTRARRLRRLGVLQPQPARLLQRGEQDAHLRDRRTARLAPPGRDHRAGRLGLPVRQAPQGGRRVDRSRPGRQHDSRCRASPEPRRRDARRSPRPSPAARPPSSRSGRPRSPARSRSATPRTAPTSCASRARPAGSWRASPRRNSSRASSCWRRARASSPRPPAGSPWPCCASLRAPAAGEGDETVVAYITGAGLKTADCVASRAPALTPVPASLRAVRERYAGLI